MNGSLMIVAICFLLTGQVSAQHPTATELIDKYTEALNSTQSFIASYESVLELYYNAQITPWLALSPSVQYVANPGGDSSISDAVVCGVRAQIAF